MLPSQATRIFPRTAIPCTSVAQVLTLVHNEYLQKRGTTTAVRRISDAPSRISSTVSGDVCVGMRLGADAI